MTGADHQVISGRLWVPGHKTCGYVFDADTEIVRHAASLFVFRPLRGQSVTSNLVGKVTELDGRAGTFTASLKDRECYDDVLEEYLPYSFPLIARPRYKGNGHLAAVRLMGMALRTGDQVDERCGVAIGWIPPPAVNGAELRAAACDPAVVRWKLDQLLSA
jgi:hypothetical protein